MVDALITNSEDITMELSILWNPLRHTGSLDPIADFENMFSNFGMRPLSRDIRNMLDIKMDMPEDDKAYHVGVDVPGVKKEDIDVTIEGNQAGITTEVKREISRDDAKNVYSERYYGKAYRGFWLPVAVDRTKSKHTTTVAY